MIFEGDKRYFREWLIGHIAWILIFNIIAVSAHAGSDLTLRLLARVTVNGEWILVKDVVELGSMPSGLKQQIEDLVITHAPPVSHGLIIEKERIQQRLSSFSPSLILNGAEKVIVRRDSQVVDASILKRTVTREIAQQLAGYDVTPDQYRIYGIDQIHDVRVPSSEKIHIKVERFQPELPASRVMAWVDIWGDQARLESISIPLKVDIVQEVWTTTRDMQKGELIRPRDLSSAVLDNADIQYWPKVKNIVGMEIKRDIEKGSPLAHADTGSPSLFSKDELVSATFRSGVVSLELTVKLLEPGNPGQRITAERENGRKIEVYIDMDGNANVVGKYEE